MKTPVSIFWSAIAAICISASALGAEYESTLTYPRYGEPGVLRIASGEGDITVTGYNGNEVVILSDSELPGSDADSNDERARGLRRISGNSFRVHTDEKENAVIINRSMQQDADLEIRVPRRTSVYIGGSSSTLRTTIETLASVQKEMQRAQERNKDIQQETEKRRETTGSTVIVENSQPIVVPMPQTYSLSMIGGGINSGDITISDITGSVEVSAIDGDITISNVIGSAVASSVEGDVTAELVRLTDDNPLSFSSVDGDIQVILPADLKADVQLKSTDGDIYTNYDISMGPVEVEQSFGESYYWSGGIGNSIAGTINGGGRDLTLKTVEGDIFFRKAE